MKKIIQTTLLLLALLLPSTANARIVDDYWPLFFIYYDFEVDGIYYLVNGSTVAVSFESMDYWKGDYGERLSLESFSNYSGDVVIPETVTYDGATYSVTSISEYAFCGCSELTSISIPNSVTSIGDNAFKGCSGLISVHVDSDNQIFDSRDDCNAIIKTGNNSLLVGCKNTTIPNSVTSICGSAFYGCSELASISIPNSVTFIGKSAFEDCAGLASVIMSNSVAIVEKRAFYKCSALASLIMSNSITSIGDSAFSNCSAMTSVTIPGSVTSIGNYAFSGCSELTSVTIPSSVTSIGDYAFSDCVHLTDVYSYITDPSLATIGSSVFYLNTNYYSNRTLYVPAGLLASYLAESRWGLYFGTIVEMEPEPYLLAESIKLNVTTAGLNEGATLQLTATVLPEEGTSKKMNWASSNPSIATVDSNGLVTTHGVGTATITAMTTDGSNLSASCTVTLLPVGVKGDVNGDYNISIADVTALIDFLLSGSN